MTDQCSTCKFFKSTPDTDPPAGECRVSPPQIVAASAPNNVSILTKWPEVDESDWCGEFIVL